MKLKLKPTNKIIILAALILIAGVLGGVYFVKNRQNSKPVVTPTNPQQETVNLSPPTEEDAQRVASNKEKIVERETQTSQQQGAKKTVKPTITYAGAYAQNIEVGSYVTSIFEDGGTCTATFKLGSKSFTKSVTAVKNANSVNCPTISVPISDFPQKGTWSVTIGYESATASGVSDSKQVDVQ